jgi:hypothetical protein
MYIVKIPYKATDICNIRAEGKKGGEDTGAGQQRTVAGQAVVRTLVIW